MSHPPTHLAPSAGVTCTGLCLFDCLLHCFGVTQAYLKLLRCLMLIMYSIVRSTVVPDCERELQAACEAFVKMYQTFTSNVENIRHCTKSEFNSMTRWV